MAAGRADGEPSGSAPLTGLPWAAVRAQRRRSLRVPLPALAVPGGGGRRARPKMAEYVQVLKRALKHIGGHGGARGAILQLLR